MKPGTFLFFPQTRRAAVLVAALFASALALPAAEKEDSKSVNFETLASFKLEMPYADPGEEAPSGAVMAAIPAEVKDLSNKSISIEGYMLPLATENGKVTEFLLMRSQVMCCFGGTPAITEWVVVKVKGAGVQALMDVPIVVDGLFHVEPMYENGYPVGIYRMEASRVIESAG